MRGADTPDPAEKNRRSPATAIAVAGIVATLIAAIASSWLTGHQQATQQDKTLAAQARATDKVELRGVVDQAATRLVRTQQALMTVNNSARAAREGSAGSLPSTPAFER